MQCFNKLELCLYVLCVIQLRERLQKKRWKYWTRRSLQGKKMLQQQQKWRQMVYMYQYLYHTSLDHMHLQNPPTRRKKKRRDFWAILPKHACCIVDTMAENGAADMLLAHTFLHGTSFTFVLFVLFPFLTSMKKKKKRWYIQSINDQKWCTRCAH